MRARVSARALLASILLVKSSSATVNSVLDGISLIQDGMQATLAKFEEMYDKNDLQQADSNLTSQPNTTAALSELSFDRPARISMHVDVIMIGLDNLEGSAAQHIEHTVLEQWFDHLIGKVPHSSLLGKQAAAASAHVEYDYQYHVVDAGLKAAEALQSVMQLHLRQQAAKLYISTWHMIAALASLKQTLEGIHADTDHPAAAFTLFVLNPVRSALVPDNAVYGYR
jgi:hypothetical protein